MLKAAIFDVDNTLYDYDAAHAPAYRALSAFACEKLSLTQEAFDELHAAASRMLEAHSGGHCAAIHNRLIRYQLMLESLGQPIALAPAMAELYWGTLLRQMRACPGARESLARIKALGLTVGIGTNMTADWQFSKLERLGLLPYIDFMVSSEEAGAEKPDRRLFDLCVKKAGCDAGECAFIGDSLKGDALGARNAGLRPVWFCPGSKADTAPSGVLCVQSLDALPELLASL